MNFFGTLTRLGPAFNIVTEFSRTAVVSLPVIRKKETCKQRDEMIDLLI